MEWYVQNRSWLAESTVQKNAVVNLHSMENLCLPLKPAFHQKVSVRTSTDRAENEYADKTNQSIISIFSRQSEQTDFYRSWHFWQAIAETCCRQ